MRSQWVSGWCTLGVFACMACGASGEGALPPDVQDPTTIQTPAGALARYREALTEFSSVFDAVIVTEGIVTDELTALPTQLGTGGFHTGLDSRMAPVGTNEFVRLHRLRAQAREARGFLKEFNDSPALRGHLYAVEGYAEIFLADLFCSGIPLSTVDFGDNYTLAGSSTTSEVYEHAIALFDTALALAGDSSRVQHLAAVGRGRALLALGHYAAAANAVTAVPNNYRYQLSFAWGPFGTENPADSGVLMWYGSRPSASSSNIKRVGAPSAGNLEGGNGLDFRTSGDVRTLAAAKGIDVSVPANAFFFPRKYTTGTPSNELQNPVVFTVADGVEARLIEAEAALQVNPGDGVWLDKLNHLRQTAWTSIVPATTSPLPDLTDPETDNARVDLLFRERALWLYLTGHRQGDLRRLIRQYLRAPETVYPTGIYRGGTGVYGREVSVPVPDEEQLLNQKYSGCIHRNA